MLVLISRLVEQKGLDLLTYILEELLQEDLQLVICGVGEAHYENAFRYWAGRLPKKLSANIIFSPNPSPASCMRRRPIAHALSV